MISMQIMKDYLLRSAIKGYFRYNSSTYRTVQQPTAAAHDWQPRQKYL